MTNLIFNLQEADTSKTYGHLYLSPLTSSFSYSGSIVMGDSYVQQITQPSFIVYNVIPTSYNVRISTQYTNTRFSIQVPETNGGVLDITTLII